MLGENCRLQNIKFHVKLFDQLTDDRLVDYVLGESQYIDSGVHNKYLVFIFVSIKLDYGNFSSNFFNNSSSDAWVSRIINSESESSSGAWNRFFCFR